MALNRLIALAAFLLVLGGLGASDCELYVAARSGKGHLTLELQEPVF